MWVFVSCAKEATASLLLSTLLNAPLMLCQNKQPHNKTHRSSGQQGRPAPTPAALAASLFISEDVIWCAKLNIDMNDSGHRIMRIIEHRVYLSIKHIKNYSVDL